ncbi:MAG: DUF996 domain-containing protein [Spirochaetes bacterium]|nr:DUF996 domain-containing protein [Spirochaetota bacterium]
MDKTSKTLSAVGSLLIVISPIVFWKSLLNLSGLVGIVLFLVGIHSIASQLNKKEIFWEALKGIVTLAVGIIVISIVLIATIGLSVLGLIGSLSISFTIDTEDTEYLNVLLNSLYSIGPRILIVVILSAIASWILMIIYGLKMSKVSDMLNESFSNLRFKEASILFKLGGWLSIILVGFILIWVAWLLYTIDFFSLPESQPSA